MIKLIKYLKKSWYAALIAPLFMLVEVIMDLYQPALMADIIDIGVANGDLAYVLSTGLKMLIFALVGIMGGVGCTVFASVAAASYGTELRQAIFDKIQSFSFKEIDSLKTSSLITRVTNDVTQLQNILLMGLKIMVRSPLLFIGGIIMACRISLKLSTIFLVIVPLITLFVFFITKKAFPMFSVVQQKIDRVNTVMRENLLGVRVIKAFVGHGKEAERFDAANDDLMNTGIKAQQVTLLIWPFIIIFMNFSVIAVLWFGGNMAISGTISTGQIMAYINYLTQIMFSLMMSIMLFINLSRGKASADRINEVLDSETSIKEPENPVDTSVYDIEFKNVYFKYHDTSKYVLENISFKLNEGETVGIIGATGSGKSSLISLIPRLYDTTQGEIKIGGVNVRNWNLKSLRDKIGVVLQESILFSGTIEDNLKFGNQDADDLIIEESVKIAQAYDFISKMPESFKSEVEQRGKNLSGGQKQRVSISRTLIRNPKILILDDSSSALDMSTEAKFQNSLKRSNKHCVTIIIAQRISGVMYCDKIIVLDDGKISGIGSHNELLNKNDIYRSIVISQLGKEAVENVG